MASLVLKMSVSLDGYVAPIDGSTHWTAAGRSADALRWSVEAVGAASAHLMLKQECSGGYLLAHGGARFARSLVETGLIDEYRLLLHPVVLGAGERIFLAPLAIDPTCTTVFTGGAVAHVFAVR
jgi:riboflavin biosynthesis pyrimidine reductase